MLALIRKPTIGPLARQHPSNEPARIVVEKIGRMDSFRRLTYQPHYVRLQGPQSLYLSIRLAKSRILIQGHLASISCPTTSRKAAMIPFWFLSRVSNLAT